MDVLQNILIYAGSFVLVLSVVVFVHEFGHFQVARWRGVAIDTFSIGFGKTLLGWRDKHGVQWKVGALPLGGYVKFADDADAMSTAPREKIEDPATLAEARKKGLFHAQPVLTRSLVVAAGPVTNFIFSILAFATLALVVGRDVTPMNEVPARIAAVTPDSAAQRAGLQPNDVIRSVNGQPIASFSAFQAVVTSSAEQPLELSVDRGGALITLSATPARSTGAAGGPAAGQGVLGVRPLVLESERVIERIGILESVRIGATDTWGIIAQTGGYIGGVFTGRESGNQIAGPLGIINVSGQVATSALNGGDGSTTRRPARLPGAVATQFGRSAVGSCRHRESVADSDPGWGTPALLCDRGCAWGQAIATCRSGVGVSGRIRGDGEFVLIRNLE
ncbi:MAG: RIP metalloprotease [Caulobacteraceae bacterium]|nr:RIP metalloprotease [Caulobacteraceae bacterium]